MLRMEESGSQERERRNLSVGRLVEAALAGQEGILTSKGALRVGTGAFTGRSPADRYIVREPSVADHVDWSPSNQPIGVEHFNQLYDKCRAYIAGKQTYVFEGYAGAGYRLPVRIVNEYAWHNLFVRQLFLHEDLSESAAPASELPFTLYALPGLLADPATDGTRTETFIVISFEQRVVLIGGTAYAGEIKKSVFTVLNYLLPFRGILPMHCAANASGSGEVALFFGLSGTGKTTLSSSPDRRLIGDDEHGWGMEGVFNFEGGCYAKCAGLSQDKEPQIWNAIQFGTVLENVTVDPHTGEADYANNRLTENTRAAYPVGYIPNAVIPGVAGHPETIFFLTADAFGVLPPIAKLTPEQAIYHFLSGYTSKLAGTERGVKEPEAVFSACFGAPFFPLNPQVYARLLADKIERSGARVYLLNTGWQGGPYGVGSRIALHETRLLTEAVLSGEIEQADFSADPVFGLLVPDKVAGLPSGRLQPRSAWSDPAAYDRQAGELARLFAEQNRRFVL